MQDNRNTEDILAMGNRIESSEASKGKGKIKTDKRNRKVLPSSVINDLKPAKLRIKLSAGRGLSKYEIKTGCID